MDNLWIVIHDILKWLEVGNLGVVQVLSGDIAKNQYPIIVFLHLYPIGYLQGHN